METSIPTLVLSSEEYIRCRFYLEKKKRFCRLEKMKGSDFCVEHAPLDENMTHATTQTQRIKCPLDPSHTCSKENLKKHLKKCNATKLIPKECWYVPDINSEKNEEFPDTVSSLRDISVNECKNLIEKLKNIKPETPQTCEKEPFLHEALRPDVLEAEGSTEATKKVIQNSNLLALMDKNDILQSPSCYVEFGAGRGQLTTSILKAIPDTESPSCTFLLVDRGTNRRKLDAKYRQTGEITIKRVRCDIKDLCLREIDILKQKEKMLPVVAVSKHLCGAATDLTLRCVTNIAPECGCHGGIIALCCHHRCEWAEYSGKEYFYKLGLSPRDFSIISLMSSWAVCCFREKTQNRVSNSKFDFISDAEKERIGILCKNIIDRGRVEFLTQNGFQCDLVEYTSKSVTLENVALVFKNKLEDSIK